MGSIAEYREFDIGSPANSYIAQFLDWPRTLSKELANVVDVSVGRKISFLPDKTRVADIKDCKWGGITHAGESAKWLVKKICGYLREDERRIVVFQDAYAYSTDPWVAKSDVPIICFGRDVYSILLPQHSDDPVYSREVLLGVDSPHMMGIMSSLPKDKSIEQEGLDLDTMKLLTAQNGACVRFRI